MHKTKLANHVVMLAALQAGRSMAVTDDGDNIIINSINQEPAVPVNMEIIRAEDFEFPLLYETRLYRPTSSFTPAGQDPSQNYQDFVISSKSFPGLVCVAQKKTKDENWMRWKHTETPIF